MESKFSVIINLLDALNELHRDIPSDLGFIYQDLGDILTVYGYVKTDIVDLFSILHSKTPKFIVSIDSDPSLHLVIRRLD